PSDVLLQQMPDIVRSRTLPDVPTDLRPIFQYFPLQEARISDVMTALSAVVGQKVRATPLAAANAILLFGLPQDLQTVSKMVLQL
ncbi:secretin N-terminal domain-containing protein, partial [Acinetobacter baumannii]